MALPVDRAQSNAMNLQVLKRQDDAIMEIVDTASHVVVYEFDQSNQNWKRKDVEGCLFVVKRYSAPRFQIFVNNRLSTTNMAIPVNDTLEVDSIDTFLILRVPDVAAVGGFAIYGLWFFPEEDRGKILKLLQRVVQLAKDMAPSAPPPPAPVRGPTVEKSQPEPPKPKQPKAQRSQPPQTPQAPQQQQQQQQQQQPPTSTSSDKGPRSRSRGRNKRNGSEGGANSRPTTPTAILQRPAKPHELTPETTTPSPSSVAPTTNATVPLHPAPVLGAGYTPISREEGIAAGNAILGMLTQTPPSSNSGAKPPPRSAPSQTGPVLVPPTSMNQLQPASVPGKSSSRSRTGSASSTTGTGGGIVGSSGGPSTVSKEQLKQTLIALLDEPQFFDQIYHAYVSRMPHP